MTKRNGLTYAGAGVDIDAGNALVEKIKPIVRATRRRGADAEIGGFGGVFDLKAAGFRDPLLVAANDGVGTKVKIAIEAGIHDTIGIDLVAMCVNDLVVQGAEPLFFLDYYATGKLDADAAARVVGGIARGCIEAGAALIGGETAEMPGLYDGADYDLAGFAVGAVERDKTSAQRRHRGRRCGVWPALLGASFQRIFAGAQNCRAMRRSPGRILRLSRRAKLWQSRCSPPPASTCRPLLRVLAETDGVKALAHITGGGFLDNLPRVLPKGLGVEIDPSGDPGASRFPLARGEGRHCGRGNAAHLQLRHWDGRDRGLRQGRRGFARFARCRRGTGHARRNRADRDGRAGHPFRTARAVTIRRKRTAVLISGRGSNMRALIERARDPSYPAEIVLVLSNRPDAAGLAFAKENKIACAVVDHKIYAGREEFERSMQCLLELHRVELICLAGFMRMLTPWFVGQWQGRLLNIHPALLPAYRGLDTHARALADGVKIHGCTVHFVVPAMDEGPIIAQAAVAVLDSDTPEFARRPACSRKSM